MLGQRVVETLHAAARTTETAAAGLDRRVGRAMARSEQRLANAHGHVVARSTAALTASRRRSDDHLERLRVRPVQVLRTHQSRLDLLEARLSAVDPAQALDRGYSITTTRSGQLVRRPDQVPIGSEIITRLAGGMVRSTVTAGDATPAHTTQESP